MLFGTGRSQPIAGGGVVIGPETAKIGNGLTACTSFARGHWLPVAICPLPEVVSGSRQGLVPATDQEIMPRENSLRQ